MGIKNINFKTDWILRIDADEFFTNKLRARVKKILKNNNKNISGITFKRIIKFFDKEINFGGTSTPNIKNLENR